MRKLNIFCAIQYFNWEKMNLVDSLIDMGHSVTSWDWKADGYKQYEPDWIPVKKKEMNELLLKKISKAHAEKPLDLIFGYLSDPVIDVQYIQEIKNWQIPIVNFGCNDVHTFERGNIMTAPFFDLNWTTNIAAVDNYKSVNAKVIQTPYGINPQFYRVDKRNMPKFAFDISFIGQPYGYRLPLFFNVVNAGVSYTLMGKVSYKRLIRTVLESRVCLGFSGLQNADYRNKAMKQLRLRDFEVPALGGLYLAEREPFLTELFEEDKEMLFYGSPEELVEKAVFYSRFKNRKERLVIAKAGQVRCLNCYTWEKQFEKVFKTLGVI
tara:strand:- start:1396 stop:2361 length:966 start_codon:yes stop_codon:yes gene_type:complete